MRCDDVVQALGPDPEAHSTSPELAEAYTHYASCVGCRRYFGFQDRLAHRLHQLPGPGQTPPTLRARVHEALAHEDTRVRRRRVRLFAGGGSMLAVAAATIFALAVLPGSARQVVLPLAQEARIGLAKPAAITSSDTAALREWLDAEVGYAVEIPAISEAELKGAAVTEVDGVRGAAVVYEYHGMPLTYFDLPSDRAFTTLVRDGSLRSAAADGYELAIWTQQGGTRAVAAPMPRREVVKVANECREKAGAGL
jgi:anti-sigma factor RsiW